VDRTHTKKAPSPKQVNTALQSLPRKERRHAIREIRNLNRNGKKPKKLHRETIRRRNRRAKQLAAEALLPQCPITRTDIADKDRIFTGMARRLPGSPHPSTVGRWMRFGVPITPGNKIKLRLPSYRAGSRRYTSLLQFRWWEEQLDLFEQQAAAN
jgi:hypothetical protein